MRKYYVQATCSALALAACFAANDASAQVIYSGGSSLAAIVYRQLADCWGVPVINPTTSQPATPIAAACPSTSGAAVIGTAQILYASVGSGAGKQAFDNNNGSTSTSVGLGNSPAASPQYTSTAWSTFGYPNFHFAGSDDPIVAGDISLYNSNVGSLGGAILQFPSMVVDVAIAFNGKDGTGATLSIGNSIPANGTSGLNLSRQALCGIVSGHITKWNNSILTALNNGTVLGTGNITFVHRSDGSGTTFLTTNAMVAQCNGIVGPYSETVSTTTSYAFPGLDANTTSPLTCAIIEGSDVIAWPDQNHGCSTSGFGSSATYTYASGSGGVQSAILNINGAIGYLSPNYAAPYFTTGTAPKAANIQNQYGYINGGQFLPPTPAGATISFEAAQVASIDLTSVTNPLAWSAAGVIANPTVSGAYPIAGVTWLDFYQCYSNAGSEAQVLPSIQSFLSFVYGNTGTSILLANGFAAVPGDSGTGGTWLGDIAYLVDGSSSKLGGNCSGGGV
jgi:phosphate transport system substrate-binding protein